MSKVNTVHAVAINKIMLPLIATVGLFAPDEDDLSMFQMYVGDVAHNVAALEAFNKTLDAANLHYSIMRQDTAPREHFYDVLVYIEKNALIAERSYACI